MLAILASSDTDFIRIDGGNGEDTLRLDSAITLDLSKDQFKRTSIKNIEVIDMIDADTDADSTLTLRALDVLNLSATSNTLEVKGNNLDELILKGPWSEDGLTYTNGLATVEVSDNLDVEVSDNLDGEDNAE